jgi:NDP-mannose synthase
MKAVVLAGGQGARMAPYTRILPKPLLPVGDMPILEILLRQMKRAGIEDIILTVGHLAQLMRLFFQDGRQLGLNITYSLEDCPLGTAGPLSLLPALDDTFLVTNGDILTTLNFATLVEAHRSSGAAATIATHTRHIRIDLGVIQFNGGTDIVGYSEKPTLNLSVSMGVYCFEPRVLSYIPYNEYLDFPDLVLRLIAAGELVQGYPFDGYWQDLGRPDDYEAAVKDFEALKPEFLEGC